VSTCDVRCACAVCGVRCAMCDVRYAMCDVRCAVCGVRCAMCDMRYAICDMRCAMCDMRCAICDVRCAVCDVRCALRLAVHHPVVLNPKITLFTKDIRLEVDSLRSSIAKNALMCASDLFECLGKTMDTEINILAPSLLKRAADTSTFLQKDAEKALTNMLQYLSLGRTLALLVAERCFASSPALIFQTGFDCSC
jgi:hypothetical protein